MLGWEEDFEISSFKINLTSPGILVITSLKFEQHYRNESSGHTTQKSHLVLFFLTLFGGNQVAMAAVKSTSYGQAQTMI